MNKHLKALNQCNSNTEMLQYCNKNLLKIGRGSSRTVYLLTKNKVLKVAHNGIGKQQNTAEITAWIYIDYDRYYNKRFFAKVFYNMSHFDDVYIVQEYCDNISTKEAKPYIEHYKDSRTIKNKRAKRFHTALRDVDNTLNYKTLVDLNKGNIGRSVRGAIKIRDYGLSEHIAKQYREARRPTPTNVGRGRNLKNISKIIIDL